jgi:hypothetical protein
MPVQMDILNQVSMKPTLRLIKYSEIKKQSDYTFVYKSAVEESKHGYG